MKRSCSLRCQHQGRSRPDGIARGVHESSGTVSGNARRRKQRSRAVASALVLLSTATIEAETKDAAGPRRHCTWCARIEWHCFSDSSAGPPCDVHIMFMYVVGRIDCVERRCGALLVGYEVCHLPSTLLGAPWYRRTRVTRGPHRQRQACPILTTRAQFRCQSEYRASTVLRTCARIPTSRAFVLALKK